MNTPKDDITDPDDAALSPTADQGPGQSQDQGADDSGAMDQNEICVDLDSLSMPDEQEKMQAPEVGDKVQANIEGEVTRIEGNKAYVKMTAVNGQKVDDTAASSDADEEASLQAMAQQMPAPGTA